MRRRCPPWYRKYPKVLPSRAPFPLPRSYGANLPFLQIKQGNMLGFSLVGSDPLLSIPPCGVPQRDAFGGPRATKRDWQRCHRGGERGEAVPVI